MKKEKNTMKKLIALIVVALMLMTTLASCELLDSILGAFNPTPPCTEHVDADGDKLCDKCGAKIEDEEPPHTEHVDENNDGKCDVCGKEIPSGAVLVEEIIVSTDDEDGEGTRDNPFKVKLAQGNSVEISYVVQPKDASNKALVWQAVGEGTGLSVEDSGTKIIIAATADASSGLIEGKAADGSGVAIYLYIEVEVYNAVAGITSSTLLATPDGEYDYELVTALGTTWDMSGSMLQRGQDLLDGKIFGGSQAPRNLTYWPSLGNLGFVVSPANATNSQLVVSYSESGIIKVDIDGSWKALAAGETVVTVSSYSEPDVTMTVKVTVKDSLYRGVLAEEYANTTVSSLSSWNLDADHNTSAQFARYDDWHLVMIHSNSARGDANEDNNQKIFYMGQSDRPYGICLENNVGSTSGGSLTDASSLIWAKLTVPESAVTFNVKIGNNDKVHGQYRVLFVSEDGTEHVLTDGWQGFVSGPSESIQKLSLPETIKGVTGAMIIEHRVTEYDNNAELQIKSMSFEVYKSVTGVELSKSEGTYKPGQSFTVNASVKPDDATNGAVGFYVADESAGKGVSVDAATGLVSISADTADGVYKIIAASAENSDITAVYTLTVTAAEIAVNKWDGKSEILDGVQGIKWTIVGDADLGVGEGADIKTSVGGWSSLKLENRKITSSSYILTFGARVFHRDGETYPKFVVKINGTTVRGIGQSEDYFYVDTDETQYCSYDLSSFVGQTVTVEIGITQGTHAVVQHIEFTGTSARAWENKAELLDSDFDPWTHSGDVDSGVGEGYDIMHTGSYLCNEFVIGESYNSRFTFGARVFHRDGETYPEITLTVRDASGTDHVITAIGQSNDYVYVDTDDIQRFSYDLSAFAGQKVQIMIGLKNNATHCVITDITMTGKE